MNLTAYCKLVDLLNQFEQVRCFNIIFKESIKSL